MHGQPHISVIFMSLLSEEHIYEARDFNKAMPFQEKGIFIEPWKV